MFKLVNICVAVCAALHLFKQLFQGYTSSVLLVKSLPHLICLSSSESHVWAWTGF